ncbi:MAG: GNAT family N-acetyltransferase [Saprospiraceae bacterium]|nr:GNAT family N-acetyltransferase [Lewinella sp.]
MDISALEYFPRMETDRLILRRLHASDAKAVFRFRSDERVGKYLNRPLEENVEGCLDFIQNISEGIDAKEWLYWGLALRKNEEVIGTICLWNISVPNSRAEIGFELHPDHQGQGYMLEAVRAVLSFSFEQLQLNTIEACFHTQNLASRKLLEKNGFQFSRKLSGNEQIARGEDEELLIYYLAAASN